MSDELLSDIVAAEKEIRSRNALLEQELADQRATLQAELAAELQAEAAALEAEMATALDCSTGVAEREAASRIAEATAYAGRIGRLGAAELDPLVVRHLQFLLPEGTHDRPDEQG